MCLVLKQACSNYMGATVNDLFPSDLCDVPRFCSSHHTLPLLLQKPDFNLFFQTELKSAKQHICKNWQVEGRQFFFLGCVCLWNQETMVQDDTASYNWCYSGPRLQLVTFPLLSISFHFYSWQSWWMPQWKYFLSLSCCFTQQRIQFQQNSAAIWLSLPGLMG